MTGDRPRRGTPAAMAVLGVVALVLTGWVVVNSAFFAIRDIRVEGARNLSVEEVTRLARVESGANLVTLPVDEVARRLEDHAWILDARVERDLPTTAVITIIERRPSGWLRDPGGIAVVAGDGTVLERLQARPPDLPGIGDLTSTPAVGDRAAVRSVTLRVAASMGEPLRRQIESLRLEGPDVLASLREGGSVLYGGAEELRAKNRALAEMLRWTREEGIEVQTIDLRVPTAPSLDPVGSSQKLPPSPSP